MELGSRQAAIDAGLRAHPAYGGVVVRSRWAEDALEAALVRGVRQYVLLGAGFDSFIVRQPGWARDVAIFEIDHPATQAIKRERLTACGAAIPANVRFVAADLGQEPLASVLARSGFSGVAPAFFSWLGVTMYLTREANLATLRGIAEASAPGSEVAFTYVDELVIASRRPALEKLRAGPASIGEPWICGFDPAKLAEVLAAVGLELVEDLAGAELAARYCADRSDRLSPGRFGHVARARVG